MNAAYKKKDDIKKFTMSDVELSEYSFYAQKAKEKEMEYNFWASNLSRLVARIKDRVGLRNDPDGQFEYHTNFDQVFSTGGTFFAKKIPKPKVVSETPEEKKGNDAKQELRQESESGVQPAPSATE